MEICSRSGHSAAIAARASADTKFKRLIERWRRERPVAVGVRVRSAWIRIRVQRSVRLRPHVADTAAPLATTDRLGGDEMEGNSAAACECSASPVWEAVGKEGSGGWAVASRASSGGFLTEPIAATVAGDGEVPLSGAKGATGLAGAVRTNVALPGGAAIEAAEVATARESVVVDGDAEAAFEEARLGGSAATVGPVACGRAAVAAAKMDPACDDVVDSGSSGTPAESVRLAPGDRVSNARVVETLAARGGQGAVASPSDRRAEGSAVVVGGGAASQGVAMVHVSRARVRCGGAGERGTGRTRNALDGRRHDDAGHMAAAITAGVAVAVAVAVAVTVMGANASSDGPRAHM